MKYGNKGTEGGGPQEAENIYISAAESSNLKPSVVNARTQRRDKLATVLLSKSLDLTGTIRANQVYNCKLNFIESYVKVYKLSYD